MSHDFDAWLLLSPTCCRTLRVTVARTWPVIEKR